jgi:hypothetical protein
MDGPLPIDQSSESTFEALAEYRGARELNPWSDRKYAVWFAKGRLKHLVGFHTWVPLEEWDLAAGSMRFIGDVCWHCQAQR